MPAERRPGYDHPHFDFDPIIDRSPLRFTDPGRTLAVIPILLLEYFEDPLPAWPQPRSLAGGLDRATPNISRLSTREYGHRIGLFRLVDAMTRAGVTPTVAIDARTAEEYPFLVDWLKDHGTCFVAHGEAVTRPLGPHLSADDEAQYVSSVLSRLRSCGITTSSWLGPEYAESAVTPAVLARAGVKVVLDWACDEQPFPFVGEAAGLWGVPTFADLDDQTSLINRMLDPASYAQHLADAVRQLASDGTDNARIMTFCLRPWLTGQPFRAGILDDLLAVCEATSGAEITTLDDAMESLLIQEAVA